MPNSQNASANATQLVEQATRLWQQALQGVHVPPPAGTPQLATMLQAFTATAEALAHKPEHVMAQSLKYHQGQLALGANMLEQMLGKTPAQAAIQPEKGDNRFNHQGWQMPMFDLLKQSYLLTSQYLQNTVAGAEGLTPAQAQQAQFYTRQFIEALSPSNCLMTNPEAMSTALSTQGESLLQGMKNLLADMQKGRISMTDTSQFEVGVNIATTPGQVVYRNRLIEVIQYTPTTEKVHPTPLVICPPWINRFYILDLKAENSLVKYLTDQGFQVFMVSWKNPDASYRDVGFEDYITEGLFAATDVARSITGEKQVNVVGYCIGGTMVSAGLAILQAKGDTRIKSATFLTTLTDFANAGELMVFTDDQQVAALEARMQQDGILDGKSMASTFSLLRANDLIWNFVVQNYLLGKQPFPFDILYWNDDSTRMPCAMHSWYLRKLYVENALAKPNEVTLCGQKIDLRKINVPMYMVSALNDHITPWESCYAPYAGMASKEKRFVVTKAGHVAGVVNPPTPAGKPVKRSFWVAEANAKSGQQWLKGAEEMPDSWWPDYATWLKGQSGSLTAAPKKAGNAEYKPLCPAPGLYVKEK